MRPSLVVGVAGEPVLVRAFVFPYLLDDREEVRDNRVAGGCLADKGGVDDALVEAVDKFFIPLCGNQLFNNLAMFSIISSSMAIPYWS